MVYSRGVFAAQTLTLPGLEYHNPFPSDWPLLLRIVAPYAMQVTVPGATPGYVFAELAIVSEVGPTMAQNIVIGPVREIRVNGTSAIGDLANVSTTPRLSWSAPQLGTATGYVVTVHRLFQVGGSTRDEQVLELVSTSTEVLIPPGYLDSGQSYLVRIDALAMPNTDLASAPRRRSLPFAIAGALSGIIRP